MREIYLIMVNAENNNNKFYHMKELGDMFEVRYGRVGKSETVRTYPIYDWDKKYNEKIKKGYRDVTDMYEVAANEDYKSSDNTVIDNLLETLFSYSNNYLNKNYTIGSERVTCKMIEAAQNLLVQMQRCAENNDVYKFNYTYERLLTTIPRNINNVRNVIAKEKEDMTDIIEREQSKLNVMESSVALNTSNNKDGKTLAETMGIEIREVTKEEEENIIKHLNNDTKRHFKRAFKVVNKKTAKKFDTFCKKNDYSEDDVKYMYHGSRNQNWVGILSQGLLLNPKAPITGKMFGYGIYGSPTSRKSQGYSSLSGSYWTGGRSHHGFIAVFKFAMKDPMHVDRTNPFFRSVTYKKLQNKGHDSVFAHKGNALRNDEVIVYNEAQVDIEYLIEVA